MNVNTVVQLFLLCLIILQIILIIQMIYTNRKRRKLEVKFYEDLSKSIQESNKAYFEKLDNLPGGEDTNEQNQKS